MFHAYVKYKAKDKMILKRVLRRMVNSCFDCWIHKPKFKIRDCKHEKKEIEFCIYYDNPGENETCQGHDALDLAMAFISGVMVARKLQL